MKNKARRRAKRREAAAAAAPAAAAAAAAAAPAAGERPVAREAADSGGGKKLSREDYKRKGSRYLDDDEAPAARVEPDARTVALEACLKFQRTVRVVTLNMHLQRVIENCPVVHISDNPTPEEIEKFLDEKMKISLRNCPFAIPVKINGEVKQIPVTPAMPNNVEDRSYHIIAKTRYSDFTQIQILVEDFSGFIKGLRVVRLGEVASKKNWLLFGKGDVPSRFKPFHVTKYGTGHAELENVCMHEGVIPKLFEFYLSLDAKPDQERTTRGLTLNTTGFVCFGEAPRFLVVKRFWQRGVILKKKHALGLPLGFPELIRDWSVLSKCIFRLYLALLEMQLEVEGLRMPNAAMRMADAKSSWNCSVADSFCYCVITLSCATRYYYVFFATPASSLMRYREHLSMVGYEVLDNVGDDVF